MITLAVFEGFWGQVFEYLPFAFTVAVTVVFGLITLVYDFLWRREVPPPAGALPRIHIPVDPRVVSRRWINRGKTAAKFGCGFGIFTGFFVSIVIVACGSGAKLFDFTKFPQRNKENAAYFRCKDGDIVNACRNLCVKYKRDKVTCKKVKVDRINITEALKNGDVIISKSYFVKLVTPK